MNGHRKPNGLPMHGQRESLCCVFFISLNKRVRLRCPYYRHGTKIKKKSQKTSESCNYFCKNKNCLQTRKTFQSFFLILKNILKLFTKWLLAPFPVISFCCCIHLCTFIVFLFLPNTVNTESHSKHCERRQLKKVSGQKAKTVLGGC